MVNYVIHLPRAGGKTEKIVELLKSAVNAGKDAIIITFNETEAQRLRSVYKLEKGQVLSYHSELYDIITGRKPLIFIDNADCILRDMLGIPQIDAVSMSSTNEPVMGEIFGVHIIETKPEPEDEGAWDYTGGGK
jgi:hypothetical protein